MKILREKLESYYFIKDTDIWSHPGGYVYIDVIENPLLGWIMGDKDEPQILTKDGVYKYTLSKWTLDLPLIKYSTDSVKTANQMVEIKKFLTLAREFREIWPMINEVVYYNDSYGIITTDMENMFTLYLWDRSVLSKTTIFASLL